MHTVSLGIYTNENTAHTTILCRSPLDAPSYPARRHKHRLLDNGMSDYHARCICRDANAVKMQCRCLALNARFLYTSPLRKASLLFCSHTVLSSDFVTLTSALGKLGHPDGEKNLTWAAAKHDVIQMIPTLASCSFDEIRGAAAAGQTQWFQLYVNKDRKITEQIVRKAEKAGIKGLFITVDAPQLGRREKDMRMVRCRS